MNTKSIKTTGNHSYLSGNTYLSSQNSLSKSLHKSTDNPYLHYNVNDKNKKELKINYLNKQLSMLQEYKKTALNSLIKSRERSSNSPHNNRPEIMKPSTGQSFIAKNHVRTKLIPKERFMANTNTSMTSNDIKLACQDKRAGNDNYLDNELELLDYKGFESTIKRDSIFLNETSNSKTGKIIPTYNSDILDLLSKKQMSECNSPRRNKLNSRNILYTRDSKTDNDQHVHSNINPNGFIKYSKNASVPRTQKDFLTSTFNDNFNKMNNSNLTLESKNSEKSFNNNILFTDGGITNINIHGVINCEDIPNEIYFNDKRYRNLQDTMTKAMEDNCKKNETIREMKRTIDILKCYIKIQEV
jgi:hypothetical protein